MTYENQVRIIKLEHDIGIITFFLEAREVLSTNHTACWYPLVE